MTIWQFYCYYNIRVWRFKEARDMSISRGLTKENVQEFLRSGNAPNKLRKCSIQNMVNIEVVGKTFGPRRSGFSVATGKFNFGIEGINSQIANQSNIMKGGWFAKTAKAS
jgi:hypothetical protein